ncbi:uncharacterized protein EI90DRAFT_3115891 [Cantharellus anzutake]|uniref:uncharacterized protein n=1 Tax=Cantharellus anzutake TaxID=1750568 RepID=UPI0019080E2C|nr:uncharacterized protein EI90DRAFT_3115891 [Cantharellus anzutake]KAF8342069.1 hypothetical protein EI90DRAFT_3115891 [Cantharellus anzutake]
MAASSAIAAPTFYAPMPMPRSPDAPRFRGRRIVEFLSKYESLADAALFTEAQKCTFLTAYCTDKEVRFVSTLDGFENPDWVSLKKDLLDFYGVDEEPLFCLKDLRKFVEKGRKMKTFDHLDRYLCKFEAISKSLEAQGALAVVERDDLFFRGFPSKFRHKLKFDLQVQSLWLDLTQPPSMHEVVAAARALLQDAHDRERASSYSSMSDAQTSVYVDSPKLSMRSTVQNDFAPEFDAETSASSSTLDQMDQYQPEAREARSAYEIKSIAVSEDYMPEPKSDDATNLEASAYDSASYPNVLELNDQELRPSGLEHVSESAVLEEGQVCQTLQPTTIHLVCSDKAGEPQSMEAIAYYKSDLADSEIVNDVLDFDPRPENSCKTIHDVPSPGLDSRRDDENPHETVYESFDLDSYFDGDTPCEPDCDYDSDWESYIAKSKGADLLHSIEVPVDCLILPSDDGKACETIRNVLNSHLYYDNEKTHEKRTNVADPDLCIQYEDSCGSIYDVFSLKSYLDDEAPCKTAFNVFDSFAWFDEEISRETSPDTSDVDSSFDDIETMDPPQTGDPTTPKAPRPLDFLHTAPEHNDRELRPGDLERVSKSDIFAVYQTSEHAAIDLVCRDEVEAPQSTEAIGYYYGVTETGERSSSAKSPVEPSEGRCEDTSPEATQARIQKSSGIPCWFPKYEFDNSEVAKRVKFSMHESGEGYEDLPKKDPDKVVGHESNPNRGEAPEYVKPLPITPEFEDSYGEPPTKDPDKGINVIKYSGDGLARGYESKVTPEAESIRNVKPHSDILALNMPEGTYIICGDEIALFEIKRESEPSRKSEIARALDSAQEHSEHKHKELRPPGLNDKLNCCCSTLCTEFRRDVSMLKTVEGTYAIQGDFVVLFEDAEHEVQFRGEPNLVQIGTELKDKELRPLSFSGVFGNSDSVDDYAWDSGCESDTGFDAAPEGIGLIDPPEVILTRELNHEERDCDLIGKHAIIQGGIDAVKSPTFKNAVTASPGIRAPKHAKAPCFPGDGSECRPEKDPDKVSNANECPGDGLAREQESEETPEAERSRGVESHGDTFALEGADGTIRVLVLDCESGPKRRINCMSNTESWAEVSEISNSPYKSAMGVKMRRTIVPKPLVRPVVLPDVMATMAQRCAQVDGRMIRIDADCWLEVEMNAISHIPGLLDHQSEAATTTERIIESLECQGIPEGPSLMSGFKGEMEPTAGTMSECGSRVTSHLETSLSREATHKELRPPVQCQSPHVSCAMSKPCSGSKTRNKFDVREPIAQPDVLGRESNPRCQRRAPCAQDDSLDSRRCQKNALIESKSRDPYPSAVSWGWFTERATCSSVDSLRAQCPEGSASQHHSQTAQVYGYQGFVKKSKTSLPRTICVVLRNGGEAEHCLEQGYMPCISEYEPRVRRKKPP